MLLPPAAQPRTPLRADDAHQALGLLQNLRLLLGVSLLQQYLKKTANNCFMIQNGFKFGHSMLSHKIQEVEELSGGPRRRSKGNAQVTA